MKKISKLVACVLLTFALGLSFGCASMEKKDYVPSEDKFFNFAEITDEDGNVVAYEVALGNVEEELPETLSLPSVHDEKPVTAIAENGFADSAVKKVNVPSSVAEVKKNAFKGCRSLTKVYFFSTYKTGCAKIDSLAFSGCSALTELDLPKSLKEIGSFAFEHCAMKSLTVPRSVTKIGGLAFSFCTDLEKVTVGLKLSDVGEKVFAGCSENLVVDVPAGAGYYFKNGEFVKK